MSIRDDTGPLPTDIGEPLVLIEVRNKLLAYAERYEKNAKPGMDGLCIATSPLRSGIS